ncbi:uncharacterized protein FFE2_01109 [Fusarium fujikuroi]|nr:uncharacterized protein FFE2_01109 [Fusarium fujikuroi]SCV27869.1 uncharacterized protein FFFS_01108 [Fusarium fujikuroi]
MKAARNRCPTASAYPIAAYCF